MKIRKTLKTLKAKYFFGLVSFAKSLIDYANKFFAKNFNLRVEVSIKDIEKE